MKKINVPVSIKLVPAEEGTGGRKWHMTTAVSQLV